MKAVVFHGVGDVRLDDVPEPAITEPTDAIVRLTASAIGGTDLHFIRGTMPGTQEGRAAMMKNLTVTMGNGNHGRYEQFDRREQGWLKVKLEPAA